MTAIAQFHKAQIQVALNWLNLIQFADIQIAKGIDVEWWKSSRQSAVNGYAGTISSLFKSVLDITDIKIEMLVLA